MTRPGLVVALAAEMAMLGPRPLQPGTITELAGGLRVTLSGMGPLRARRAGQRLLAAGADALLSWGCAGALDGRLTPGSLLLPRVVLTADGAPVTVDAGWHDRLYRRLAPRFAICTEPLLESPAVVSDPAVKQALFARTGAAGVDLESAALGRLAQQARVPFLVIRVVADAAAAPVPVPAAVDVFGRVRPLAFVAEALHRPRQWPALVRLARDFRRARRTLAGVAAQLNGVWC